MREPELIVEEPAEGVVLARLNRPDRLNALTAELMTRLESTWYELRERPDVRCVVLTGTGRGFCSGADTAFLAGERAPRGAGLREELSFVPGRILDVPVVVAVNGVCAGGGLHFVADADIVIAAESATFLDPHVSVGQVSGVEPPSLALRLPLPVIARMALMGREERVPARRMYELGLVTEVVADDELVDRAVAVARVVASASPAAARATRRSYRRLAEQLTEPAMRDGWEDVQRHWSHSDATEGPAAARDRRPPRWSV